MLAFSINSTDFHLFFEGPFSLLPLHFFVPFDFRTRTSYSQLPCISGDGASVVFESNASNLVDGDTNGVRDVFVVDVATGAITRLSQNASSVQGNGYSANPSISVDGRYVAFQSFARNLIDADVNFATDIFVKDRQTGILTAVSRNGSGVLGNLESSAPSISSDGRFVAFSSSADNLVAGDTNEIYDVFVAANPLTSVAPLSLNLLTPGNSSLSLDRSGIGAGQLLEGTGNAFDGLNRMRVDGTEFATSPASTSSDGGRTVVTANSTMSGLSVSREVTVPITGSENFARTMDVFSNSTGSAITVAVNLLGNLGSDAGTIVFATSDGDLIVESTDWWFGTDDGNATGGTPAVIHLLHGPAGLQPSAVSVQEDNVQWTYSLTVGAGETRRLATFTVLRNTRQQAIDAANALVTSSGFGGQATAFLDAGEIASLANFPFDVTKPVSAISALSAASSSVSLSISVTGSDPGAGASGVKEFDLYYSTGGAFVKFATVPAASPSTTFTGAANTTYWFRSLARDFAGNVETKTTADTYTRIGDVVPPASQVTTAAHVSTGLFTVQMTGTKASGSALTQFDVYVSIDSSAAILIGSANGTSLGGGNYSGSIVFQGILDGMSHNYRFYSRARDGAGNVEAAPVSGDVSVMSSFATSALTATAIDVQNGISQRSYVRYLDVLFSNAADLATWFASNRVKVERFGIDATSVTPGTGTLINGAGITRIGSKLQLDFGSTGLGGLRDAGNGFYRILLDLDGNGLFTDTTDKAFEFHRLFGDANGDGKVDVADTNLVTSQIGRTGANLDGDLDGNGAVNSTDRLYSTQQRGKKLLDPLLGWLDD